MDSHSQSGEGKQPYRMPELHRWGDVEVITQTGRTHGGADTWPTQNQDDFFPGSSNKK